MVNAFSLMPFIPRQSVDNSENYTASILLGWLDPKVAFVRKKKNPVTAGGFNYGLCYTRSAVHGEVTVFLVRWY